jgi:catechol 2,3-dioxygenase-like lactoylglutathione lyase family enzyme
MNPETKIRIARPTDQIEEVIRFYRDGVGLSLLGSFENHEGFDGVMLGVAGAAYHLEFTHAHGHSGGRAPTQDNLLVFYFPEKKEWQAALDRMEAIGYQPVPSVNPYWDRAGKTFEDPDGYRVVFQNSSWPANG